MYIQFLYLSIGIVKLIIAIAVISAISGFLFVSCQPIREFHKFESYEGQLDQQKSHLEFQPNLKNIFIIADNEGTEIFDLLGPFYLFNATELANVIIVSQDYSPITLQKGLFILPHFTYKDLEEKKLNADIIVIPNLSKMKPEDLDPEIIKFIKDNYRPETRLLSVCDGSITAAATGLFDGKLITTHASDYDHVKSLFDEPVWVKNINVTKDGNLYSTAGVSNAVEGSLTVIKDVMGDSIMNNIISSISYPHRSIQNEHSSTAISGEDKWTIFKKIAFKKNKKLGVMLHDDISEFHLAALLDTYHRTFPKSIKSFTFNNEPILSRYGLTIIPTGSLPKNSLDEMHFIQNNQSIENLNTDKIIVHEFENSYVFDKLFKDIKEEYGSDYQHVVKVLLDYN